MKNYLKAGLILAIGGGTILYAHSKIQDPTQKTIIEVPIALATAGGMIAAMRSRNYPHQPSSQERTHRYQTPYERNPKERIPLDRSQLHIHLTQDRRRPYFDLSTHRPRYYHLSQKRDCDESEPPTI